VTRELSPTGVAEQGLIPEGLDATLVMLRHGESEWIVEGRFQGQAETPLSVTGRRQAAFAALRLAQPHAAPALPVPLGLPREIVHSPLSRTTETAQAVEQAIAAAGASVPRRPEDGFKEIAQGLWEGETHDAIVARWGNELRGWRRRPAEYWAPGGESIAQVQERVRPALGRILERLGEGQPRGGLDGPQVAGYAGGGPSASHPWSILVGHDGVFKVTLLTLFGLSLTNFWTFPFALCGISVIEFRGGRAVLRSHSSTEHLAPLLDERAQEAAEARNASGAL